MSEKSASGERGPFADAAQQSFTLPSRYYLDQNILEQEFQKIFQRSWLYVEHVSDLPVIGSFITDDVAGQPNVVMCGQDNEVRAFFNVCQHRGHLLLTGRDQVKNRIVCPYHAWCYCLKGELKTARMTRDIPGFERADFDLKPVQHALVAGMIFVNLDPNATPEYGDLPEFEKTILDYLPEMREYAANHRFDFEVAANWKVVIDNFFRRIPYPCDPPDLGHTLQREDCKITNWQTLSLL